MHLLFIYLGFYRVLSLENTPHFIYPGFWWWELGYLQVLKNCLQCCKNILVHVFLRLDPQKADTNQEKDSRKQLTRKCSHEKSIWLWGNGTQKVGRPSQAKPHWTPQKVTWAQCIKIGRVTPQSGPGREKGAGISCSQRWFYIKSFFILELVGCCW